METGDLRHACAVLGLSLPVSEDELKRRYKALVKRWHPDRFQADPTGQVEATQRLCDINIAYDLVTRSLETAVPPRPTSQPAPREAPPSGPTAPTQSWPRERVDSIVDSINESNRMPLLPDWAWHQIISGTIVMLWLIPWARRGGLGAILMSAAFMLLPLAFIWFPNAFGVWTLGRLSIAIQKSSPGFVVRLVGWLSLLLCLTLLKILLGPRIGWLAVKNFAAYLSRWIAGQ